MIHAGYKGSRQNSLHANADFVLFLQCRDLYIMQESPKKTFYYFNKYRKNKDN